MKKLVVICSAIILLRSCSADQLLVSIPANQTVELDYSSYELYTANLKNKSMQGLEVAVLSKDNNDRVRGWSWNESQCRRDCSARQSSRAEK